MQYAYKVARSDRALNFITSTSTTLKPQLLKHWLERGGADSVEASFATELRSTSRDRFPASLERSKWVGETDYALQCF